MTTTSTDRLRASRAGRTAPVEAAAIFAASLGAFALAGPLAGCALEPGDPAPIPVADAGPPPLPCGAGATGGAATRVILFVGDGMGAEHVEAARAFQSAGASPLVFEGFPVRGLQRTANASGAVTDSAAAATAMATGHKVDNGVLSLAIPGDGAPLPTALELHRDEGHRTGLVTTHTALTDATPAAFGAHVPARGDHAAIAAGYLGGSRPHALFGPAGPALAVAAAEDAGYVVVEDADAFAALDGAAVERAAALFPGDAPDLAVMTSKALELLARSDQGFFLLVEHEDTDEGAHQNDLQRVVDAVLELDRAVRAALSWCGGREDVLIVVTADHETGGLDVDDDAPQEQGVLPQATFSTGGHTSTPVPIYATGPGASLLEGEIENTGVFEALTAGL